MKLQGIQSNISKYFANPQYVFHYEHHHGFSSAACFRDQGSLSNSQYAQLVTLPRKSHITKNNLQTLYCLGVTKKLLSSLAPKLAATSAPPESANNRPGLFPPTKYYCSK